MIKHGQHPVLPLIFFTGGAVLAIEVAATRLLAPSFGTTVFAVSSVISVVLGALSLGYYLGGRWADRVGSALLFYALITGAGVSVFAIEFGLHQIVPSVSALFGLLFGPLLASLALFFVPSTLLGALSPFAVVLYRQQRPQLGVGQAAGSVSFWSTLGSIAGSLSTAFVFIPNIGLSWLLFGVGLALTAIGCTGLALSGLPRRQLIGLILIALTVVGLAWLTRPGRSVSTLYEKDGRYSRILIAQDDSSGHPVRTMMLDGSYSAARSMDSDKLVYPYTQYSGLFHALRPDAKQALVIGGGAYSIPQALVRQFPEANVDVAEVEPDLYDLSQKYFGVEASPRLHNYVEDGRRILQGKDGHYDLIFGDAYYSVSSIPQHLATQEFFEKAKASLTDNGIFMANIIGKLEEQHPSFTLSEMRTFQTVFPHSMFIAVGSPEARQWRQNLMFIGFKGEVPNLDQLSLTDDDDREIVRRAQTNRIDLGNYYLANHPVFTDDFAPVDYYIATSVSLGS